MSDEKINVTPFFSALGNSLLAFIICGLGTVVDSSIHKANSQYPEQGLCYVIVALLIMVAFVIRRSPLKMPWKCGYFKYGMLLCIIPGIYSVGYLFFATTTPTMAAIIISLGAGVVEDICFRYVPVNILMKENRFTKKIILPTVIFTSAVFGLIHLTNIFAGAAVGITLFQVFNAFCLGTIVCAIYLRCGNIFPCVIWHFVHDVISFLNESMVSESGIMETTVIDASMIYDIVFSIILLVVAMYLIRPSKRDAIISIWKDNWNVKE